MGEWIVKQQVWQGSINYRRYMEPKVMEVWFRFCPFQVGDFEMNQPFIFESVRFGLVECDQLHSEYRQFCHCFMHVFWVNYSDLSRGHPKGNARLPKCLQFRFWKYSILPRGIGSLIGEEVWFKRIFGPQKNVTCFFSLSSWHQNWPNSQVMWLNLHLLDG